MTFDLEPSEVQYVLNALSAAQAAIGNKILAQANAQQSAAAIVAKHGEGLPPAPPSGNGSGKRPPRDN